MAQFLKITDGEGSPWLVNLNQITGVLLSRKPGADGVAVYMSDGRYFSVFGEQMNLLLGKLNSN